MWLCICISLHCRKLVCRAQRPKGVHGNSLQMEHNFHAFSVVLTISCHVFIFQENIGMGFVGEQMSSAEKVHLSRSMLQYSLLAKNLLALEETSVALDSLRMERDIMLQMGKLGAAELFKTCLSRSRGSSTTSCLSDTGNEVVGTTLEQKAFVSSRRKLKKKATRSTLMTGNSDQDSLKIGSRTTWKDIDVPRVRRPSKYRKKRERISRNEAEMSTGVKVQCEIFPSMFFSIFTF